MPEDNKLLYCSFCGKSQHDVFTLIVGGPSVFICDECTDLCIGILDKTIIETENKKLVERMQDQIDDGKTDFMPNLNSIIQQVRKI